MIFAHGRLGTFLQLLTNTLHSQTKGGENTTIHFQSMMTISLSIISSILYHNSKASKLSVNSFHFHITNPEEIKLITEDYIEGDSRWLRVRFESLKGPYTWVPKEKLMFKTTIGILESKLQFKDVDNLPLTLKEKLCYDKCSIAIIKSIFAHLSSNLSSSMHRIPEIWAIKLDPIKLLEYTVSTLISYWLLKGYKGTIIMNSYQSIMTNFGQFLTDIPHSAFTPLCTIYGYKINRSTGNSIMITQPDS
jgi:hypothetical protein